jgi:hypothetical protein
MGRPKRHDSIHSRPAKKNNRRICYAVFRDQGGKHRTAASTGCTRRDGELPRPC